MNCPGCASPMQLVKYEGVMIDQCGSCGGTWLDYKEISRIIQSTEEEFSDQERSQAFETKSLDTRPSGKTLQCSSCKTPLETFYYLINSGVVLDRCNSCKGIYFDAGELEKAQILMEQQLIDQGTHPSQQTTREDGKKSCPRDGSDLKQIKYEGETLDQCSCCGGVWCDDEELQSIVSNREVLFAKKDFPEIKAQESLARPSVELDLVDWLLCVKCQTPMKRLNFSHNSGIVIDRCAVGHGVWLDYSELERIQVFAERWADKAPELKVKYASRLNNAKEVARTSFERAEKEGKASVHRHTIIGRMFKGM